MSDVLERLTYQFLMLPEDRITLIYLGGLVLGGLLAFLAPAWTRLARAPYFALSWLVMLGVIAAQFVWYLTGYVVELQLMWVLLALSMLAFLLGGYLYGRLAMARARDAFGGNMNALLAFIPLLNLVLYFAPGRVRQEKDYAEMRVPALFKGWMGIVTGLLVFAGFQALNLLAILGGG